MSDAAMQMLRIEWTDRGVMHMFTVCSGGVLAKMTRFGTERCAMAVLGSLKQEIAEGEDPRLLPAPRYAHAAACKIIFDQLMRAVGSFEADFPRRRFPLITVRPL